MPKSGPWTLMHMFKSGPWTLMYTCLNLVPGSNVYMFKSGAGSNVYMFKSGAGI